MLFMRGKAMSGAPIISGTSQLPKPPIKAGMTTKKTMTRPCEVTTTLYSAGLLKICRPGYCSSARISSDRAAPNSPAITAKIR